MDQSAGSTGGLSSVVPDAVVNRTVELERLASVLEPLTRDEQTDTVLVTGRPGTGKTCVTASTVDRFLDENPDFGAVYVNCWEDDSTFQVLYRILDAVGRTVDIHRQSTPQDVLLERLRTYDGLPCIVIFDEADQLEEEGILYDLLGLPRFTLLLIANRADDLLGGVDDRLESRLRGTERVEFGRYTKGQLVDILDEVASSELDGQSVDRSAFEAIASLAAGDARVATTVLRIAARRADGGSSGRITPENIGSALPVARQELRRKTVEDLAHHQRAVYQVIEDRGRVTPSELYEQYRDRVENPKTDRTVRNYLTKLERYNLVVSEGSFRDRVYRCVGHGIAGGDS